MTSNRCFCNRGLLRENLRRNLWVIVLSAVGFFFVLPLPVAIAGQRMMQQLDEIKTNMSFETSAEVVRLKTAAEISNVLTIENFFVKAGFVILAIVCGVMLFSYLHNRMRVDFYHSLPISRSCLFGTRYLSGLCMVLLPYVVMQLLAIVFAYGFGLGAGVSWAAIAKTVAVHLVFFLAIYTISVCCTVLTGNTVIAVLLDLWALGSLSVFIGILSGYCEIFFDTFYTLNTSWLTRLSPVVQYFSITDHTSKNGYLLDGLRSCNAMRILPLLGIYLVFTIALLVLTHWLFRRRKSERSGMALSFQLVKLPIKIYMVTFLSLAFGLLFYMLGGSFWIWFGLVAGVVISHIVIEIIYHFDFRSGLVHWPTMLVMSVLVCALVCALRADLIGYDNWVPSASSVQAAGIDFWCDRKYDANGRGGQFDSGMADLETAANLERICAIAQTAVDKGMNHGSGDYYGDNENIVSFQVFYYMSSGRVATRSYYGVDDGEILEQLNDLRLDEEYQTKRNPLFSYDPDEKSNVARYNGDRRYVPGIQVRTASVPQGGNEKAQISDREQMGAVLEALREETLMLTAEQVTHEVPVLRLDLGWFDDRYSSIKAENVPVYQSFTKTLSLIEQFTGVQPDRLTVDDVTQITVYYSQYNTVEEASDTEDQAYTTRVEDYSAVITDPLQMAVLLENCVTDGMIEASDYLLQGYWYQIPLTDSSAVVQKRCMVEATLNSGVRMSLYYPEDEIPYDVLRTA